MMGEEVLQLSKGAWPRQMTRGIFKGRVFTSARDYRKAYKELRHRQPSRDAIRHAEPLTPRQIVEIYELLQQEGLGKTKALRILDTLQEKRP